LKKELITLKKTFAFLLFLLPAVLFAQESNPEPPKFALVIGNGAYRNLSRLTNPVNDANDMALALEYLGFTVDKLLDSSLEQMENAVTNLKEKLNESKDAYGFFFYAGHGVQSGGENYLIPVNANIPSESYLRNRALSVQIILDDLNEAGNSLNVIVLDACRDNPFGWSRTGSLSRGLAVVGRQPTDSIIVYATSVGQTASDGEGRNGLFTSRLLPNLVTPGLEVSEVFRRTGADVSRESNNRQIPAIYSQFFGTAWLGIRPDETGVIPPAQPFIWQPVITNQGRGRDETQLWSVGALVGTSFAAPLLVGTVSATIAPMRYSFFEIGVDLGLLSGVAEVGYYSVCPFARYSLFLPLAGIGGFFIGAGGGYYIAEFDFPDDNESLRIFALDISTGFRFNNGITVSNTVRSDFSSVSNTLSIGYRFRFRE